MSWGANIGWQANCRESGAIASQSELAQRTNSNIKTTYYGRTACGSHVDEGLIVWQVRMFLSKLKTSIIWVNSESANAAGCKPVSLWEQLGRHQLGLPNDSEQCKQKDKNEIVPCMVDKPINHLLNLLESCTAPLAIITRGSSCLNRSNKSRKIAETVTVGETTKYGAVIQRSSMADL